ncbi:MAG: hypothetical protein J5658_03690 [Prevotella sp.]|nr:hypothetical protein [Prevotella sp.]
MKGFEIRFNVYAETQEEADRASHALRSFVDGKARQGVAVTADKIFRAVERWKDSYMVNNYLK